MNRRSSSTGFTLIEVLIVVALLAVLAGVILPQVASSSLDAKESALKFNLNSLRTHIDRYKLDHGGQAPAISNGSLPQLTSSTDDAGNTGAAGSGFPHGPYMVNGFPPNPVTGSSSVSAMSSYPPTSETGAGGWQYNATTGQIAPDSANYLAW